jgi:hypothetical protein
MMYVLTSEEYADLLAAKETKLKLSGDRLQRLCTKIAETMPVKWSWGPGKTTPQPWTCILTKGNEDWHCDECPVQSICPGPKSYSQ